MHSLPACETGVNVDHENLVETGRGSEIELISDADGLAVIGDAAVIERFMVKEGLLAKDLGMAKITPTVTVAGAALNAASQIAANSGRWMQLTEESAKVAHKYAMVHNTGTGYAHATLRASNGQFVKNLQFVNGPGVAALAHPVALLANPALLAGVGGLMTQLAMQRAMEEITEYLAVIDAKVDDVLPAQKDAVLADMIAVGLVIDEAIAVRERVGRVSEVTWSKVQGTSLTIARTQAYALLQLDALAEKLETKSAMGDLADAPQQAQDTVQDWLAVLARCAQLYDALAALELDRVLDAAPDELNSHRIGLRSARDDRFETIARSTGNLLARINAVASLANTKVLLHPTTSPSVVRSAKGVAASVTEFHRRIGIEPETQAIEARRWRDAAADAGDKALATGAESLDAALRLGDDSLDRARTATGKFAGAISERLLRGGGGRTEG
jgi:hypothetical protein